MLDDARKIHESRLPAFALPVPRVLPLSMPCPRLHATHSWSQAVYRTRAPTPACPRQVAFQLSPDAPGFVPLEAPASRPDAPKIAPSATGSAPAAEPNGADLLPVPDSRREKLLSSTEVEGPLKDWQQASLGRAAGGSLESVGMRLCTLVTAALALAWLCFGGSSGQGASAFSNRSRGLERAAVPASACAVKQRTKVAWLVFGLALTLAGTAFSDKAGLRDALGEWCADAAAAQATRRHVSARDVSAVTDMSLLWPRACRTTFDEHLNAWDVGRVTTTKVRCCPRPEPLGVGGCLGWARSPLPWTTCACVAWRSPCPSSRALSSQRASVATFRHAIWVCRCDRLHRRTLWRPTCS